MTDMESVSHPTHYVGPHECIEVMEALFGIDDVKGFCRCNSFKYRFRAGKKEGASAEEDLAKAQFYEDYLIKAGDGRDQDFWSAEISFLKKQLKRTDLTESQRAFLLKQLTECIRTQR